MSGQRSLQHVGWPGVQSIVASREGGVLLAEEEGPLLCQLRLEYLRLTIGSSNHPNLIYWVVKQVSLQVNIGHIHFAQFPPL